MASTLQFIVDNLREPPFNRDLTLVAFDELSPYELIQLLNDVLSHISSQHKIDPQESPEWTTEKIIQLLTFFKYPFPPVMDEVRQHILQGERHTIHTILHWLLQRISRLQKRAYLSQFLYQIPVPPEFLQDEEVANTVRHHLELQEEFKKVHMVVDQLRTTQPMPNELKKEIIQLEEERDQLRIKIKSLKEKTRNIDGFSALLEATSSLRREQEVENRLQDRVREQRMILAQAEVRYNTINKKLQELKGGSYAELTGEEIIKRLQQEVRENEHQLESVIPEKMEEKRAELDKLQMLLQSEPRVRDEVDDLSRQVNYQRDQNQGIKEQIRRLQQASGDDKLGMYRQQASLMTKRREENEKKLAEAEKERDRVQKEINDKQAKLNAANEPRVRKGDEFKQYASQLRNKTNQYKNLKKELNELKAETVVLARTETLLKKQWDELRIKLNIIESERGVQGYTEVQDRLEQVSSLKAQIDDAKGKTLEQMSQLVTDITTTLKDRKSKLAPQIKELRNIRQRAKEVEKDHMEAKNAFDNVNVGLESEQLKLEQECGQFQEDCHREESRFHYLNCLINIADAHIEKVQQEEMFSRGEGRFLRDFQTWQDLYQHKIQQQENLAKELRKRQKNIKETEIPNAQQMELFQQLKHLLQAKEHVYAKDATGRAVQSFESGVRMMEAGGANVMTLDM